MALPPQPARLGDSHLPVPPTSQHFPRHCTWIIWLYIHYLVTLEILIAHVLQLLSEKETPKCIPPLLWPPNSYLITACGQYCKRCTKHASLTWTIGTNWKRLKTELVKLQQPFVSGVVAHHRSSILSTVFHFRHCAVSDFLLHMLTTWTVTRYL